MKFKRNSTKYFIYLLVRYFSAKNNLDRLSRYNEFKDYYELRKINDHNLWTLHEKIWQFRQESSLNYNYYDYGHNYYYQSLPKIFTRGFRDTRERSERIKKYFNFKNKSVLDIGTYCGGILFEFAEDIKLGTGIDINSWTIFTADEIAKYLKFNNLKFIPATFKDFKTENKYDIVLSLANHDTVDGNSNLTLEQYFNKIESILNKNGILIFESHPLQIDSVDKRLSIRNIIEMYFLIIKVSETRTDNFLDKDRLHIIARKK